MHSICWCRNLHFIYDLHDFYIRPVGSYSYERKSERKKKRPPRYFARPQQATYFGIVSVFALRLMAWSFTFLKECCGRCTTFTLPSRSLWLVKGVCSRGSYKFLSKNVLNLKKTVTNCIVFFSSPRLRARILFVF